MKKLFKTVVLFISIFAFLLTHYSNAYALKLDIYTDVSYEHWAYDAIKYVTKTRCFNGYQDGSFHPSDTITRAEAMKVFVLLAYRNKIYDTSSYLDVDTREWFAPYVEAGKDLLPVLGNGEFFRPNEFITREDAIYALIRSLNLTQKVKFVDIDMLSKFNDVDRINPETMPYLAIALQLSIVSGYKDGTIRADSNLTRAEFATLIYRAQSIE